MSEHDNMEHPRETAIRKSLECAAVSGGLILVVVFVFASLLVVQVLI